MLLGVSVGALFERRLDHGLAVLGIAHGSWAGNEIADALGGDDAVIDVAVERDAHAPGAGIAGFGCARPR